MLDPDARAARQVQLGFEREGILVRAPAIPPDSAAGPAALDLGGDTGVVLVGGAERLGVDLVRRVRAALTAANLDVPIAFIGQAGAGLAAELAAAGADEVIARPAFLRDIVTVGKLLRDRGAQREHLIGSLAETTGVYTLVRALAALGRSAVLTLVRGLRRGEIRFYRGEVTSAQVGLIHGQAALHQLLLWTDARFDFQREDIVRRQQIPMTADELFADAERFLEGVREAAEQLSPSMVLEQDVQRVTNLGKQVPTEVAGVLRMFDGHRVLADILEDSPYRVFETLRVAQRALDAGLIRVVEEQRPRASWKTVLAIEEWLVGAETRDAVVERTASIDTTRVAVVAPPGGKKKKARRKKRRMSTPLPVPAVVKPAGSAPASATAPGEIDWGALVPRVIGGEVGQLAGVVPAMDAHGEIEIATRDRAREGLEALMDTGKRDRIFPTDIGIEPSVVVRDDDAATGEVERVTSVREVRRVEVVEDTAPSLPVVKLPVDAATDAADAQDRAAAAMIAQPIAGAVAEPIAEVEWDSQPVRADVAIDEPKVDREATTDKQPALAKPPATERSEALTAKSPALVKADAERAQAEAEAAKAEAARIEAERAKAEAETAEAARVEAERAKAEAAKAEAAKAEAAKVEAERAKAEAAKAEAERAKAEAAKAEAERAKAEAAKVEAAKAEAEAAKAEAAKAAEAKEPPVDPLVADLAAAHNAIAAVMAKAAAGPATPDLASPSQELVVAEVRRDAVEFSDAEEAFFDAADRSAAHAKPAESFDDLDHGYQKPKFWDRVFGRRKRGTEPPKH